MNKTFSQHRYTVYKYIVIITKMIIDHDHNDVNNSVAICVLGTYVL